MSPRFLNFVIFVSLVGITGILLKERFFPAPAGLSPLGGAQVASAQASAVEAVPTQEPDSLIPCQSSYFNFQKGNSWKYKMTGGTTFTSTVLQNVDSSVTISTKLPTTKEAIISTLTCKKSGVYGLPFIPITSKSIPTSIIDAILFIPNDSKLTKDAVWDSTIDIGVQIPLVSDGIKVLSKVRTLTENTITIGSSINMGASFLPGTVTPDKNGDILQYTLTKGVGVSSMTMAGVTATLTGFNPGTKN